jgi:hypothetical protein
MTPFDLDLREKPVWLRGLAGSGFIDTGLGVLSGVIERGGGWRERVDWVGVSLRLMKKPGPVLLFGVTTGDGALGYFGLSSPLFPI